MKTPPILRPKDKAADHWMPSTRAFCVGMCVWFMMISLSYYTLRAFVPVLCLLGMSVTGIWYQVQKTGAAVKRDMDS